MGISLAIGLAITAQSALLRTHGAIPAGPLFLLASLVGGWTALKLAPPGPVLKARSFSAHGRAWRVVLGVAVVANGGSLALFARNTGLTLAWQLFAASVVLVGLAFWLLDGRPGPRLDWRQEAPWLAALAVLVVTGAALRLVALGSIPFGLWYDEAYSGLQVQRILTDPGFRPVYVAGLAQEPSLLWYLMAASVKALGPTMLALRLPTAIGGILGIPAIYFLGRELFGRRVGLIAAGLLTTLVWHLTFSRIGFNSEWSVTLDAFGLACLVRSFRRGSWTAGALAGISLGLGLHMYYTSRLMVVVAGCALLALWLAEPRRRLPAAARVLAALVVAGAITSSPLAEFAKLHPADFNSRLQQASVFTEVREQHSYAPILDNVRAHLLMFNLAGDRNARHNLPGQPELNFLLGGLFVLGIAISLARGRRPEYLLLPVWGALMLAGGVFSVAFEAPQSLRTIDEVNVVVLLCALPLALLWSIAELYANGEQEASLGRLPPIAEPAGETAARWPAWLRPGMAWAAAHLPLALLPAWLGAALWVTAPLYREVGRAIPAGLDAGQFLWGLWWVKYAVVDLHQSPLYTTFMFAPQQVNLAFDTLMPLTGLVSIPFQLLFGLVVAFNVVLIGSLVATCLGTYLLVEQETGSRAGAFVGSLVFAFAPFKLANLNAGHLLMITWAVPFFALFLLRWLRGRRLRHAALAGVCLACVGLTDLNQLVLAALLGVALIAGLGRRREWRTLVTGAAVLGLVSAALMAPLLAAVLDGLRHGWQTATPLSASEGWTPDVLAFFTPPGSALAQGFHLADPARLVFVGYAALALGLLGLAGRGNARKWWLVALAFWVLSLGPRLHVAGATVGPPLPFAAFRTIPLIGGISNPGYFSLVLMLALAVLAGHGTAWLGDRPRQPELVAAAGGLAVLLGAVVAPLPLFAPRADAVYLRLAREPGQAAVLAAPAGWITELGGDGSLDGADLYAATVARKPIVSGSASRVPPRLIAFYREQPALRVLLFPDQPPTAQSLDAAQVTDTLHRLGVGYIVLRHWARFDQQLAYVNQTLRYPAWYADGEVAAFRVPQ